jgi:hypothetical protein
LQNRLASLQTWFLNNRLILNPSKTESLLVGSPQLISKYNNLIPFQFSGSTVRPSQNLKYLGVILDATLSFKKHTRSLSASIRHVARTVRHARRTLDSDSAKQLAVSLGFGRLDLCNSVLAGTSQSNIKSLQRAQNCLARAVLSRTRTESATGMLRELHWLPFDKRINFKLACLGRNVKATGTPSYLNALLVEYAPVRSLRSVDSKLLVVPSKRTTTARSAFDYAAPHFWNSVPLTIRESQSLRTFKKKLKTFMFS